MSEKEHPARVAGRYVRAAGVAIQKERERRAAEAAQRAAAEAQAAAAAPPPPPSETDPRTAPPPAAQPDAPRVARTAKTRRGPAQPPPLPARPFVDRFLYFTFIVSLVAVGLAALQIQMVTSGSVRVGIRLGLGIALMLTAIPLVTDWQQAKRRLTAVFFRKFWGLEGPTTRTGLFVRRIGRELLTLIGIAWLALGMFEILRAFVDP